MATRFVQLTVALLIALLLLDPYTFGSTGGDHLVEGTAGRSLQLPITLVEIAMLAAAAWCVRAGRVQWALLLVVVEFTLIVVLNGLYVWRDGVDRFFVGYAGNARPLLVLTLGALIRVGLIASLAFLLGRVTARGSDAS
jgi:hypothetical protein